MSGGGLEGVLLSVADGVARIVLNRPEKRNALDSASIAGLKEALRTADADDAVRVITLSGAGKDFCAGADLIELQRLSEAPPLENLADADSLAELFLRIRRLEKPVVALVEGRALAGGCGLATACDLVLASDAATFGFTEVRLGFVPAIVSAILRRNVPEKRAFELITSGEIVPATEAERLGLVNRVYPADRFDAEAGAYVASLAGRSASAVRLCKRILYLQDGLAFEAAIRAGADLNVIARMTPDTRDGVRRFLENSEPASG